MPSIASDYLLSIYYVPGSVLDTEDTIVNETGKVPAFLELI